MVYFLIGTQLLKKDENTTMNEIQNNVILGGLGSSGTLARVNVNKKNIEFRKCIQPKLSEV
jgi:hypothetical protein